MVKLIKLLFRNNQAASLEPLDPDEEKLVDELLKEITVSKSISWCG